jgi:hypothetical protein
MFSNESSAIFDLASQLLIPAVIIAIAFPTSQPPPEPSR